MWSSLLAGRLWCESHHPDLRHHTLAPGIHICPSLSSEVHVFCLLPVLTSGILQSDSLLRIPVSPWDAPDLRSLFTHVRLQSHHRGSAHHPCSGSILAPWCFLSDLLPPSKNPLFPDFSITYSCFLPLRIPIFSSARARYKSVGCLALSQEFMDISSFIPPPVC